MKYNSLKKLRPEKHFYKLKLITNRLFVSTCNHRQVIKVQLFIHKPIRRDAGKIVISNNNVEKIMISGFPTQKRNKN